MPRPILAPLQLEGEVFSLDIPSHRTRRVGATPPNALNVEVVANDNVRLVAWWLRPATPNGNCVIVLHGIADSRAGSAGFAPMFLTQGYGVLVPDSRAHGES